WRGAGRAVSSSSIGGEGILILVSLPAGEGRGEEGVACYTALNHPVSQQEDPCATPLGSVRPVRLSGCCFSSPLSPSARSPRRRTRPSRARRPEASRSTAGPSHSATHTR